MTTPNANTPTSLDAKELAFAALSEMAKAQEIAKGGQTGVLGVNGRPAYHVSRANVYATLALVAAQIDGRLRAEMIATIADYDDADLEREIAFADGFGSNAAETTPLWIELLHVEQERRAAQSST